MSTIDLTDTQRAILTEACSRPDGAVFPVTTGPKGGALLKVLGALAKRGLIEGEGETAKATAAAHEALGLPLPALTEQPSPTAVGGTGPDEALADGTLTASPEADGSAQDEATAGEPQATTTSGRSEDAEAAFRHQAGTSCQLLQAAKRLQASRSVNNSSQLEHRKQ